MSETNGCESEPKRVKTTVPRWPLEKIISGGQSGADYAGLRAAIKLGLKTGGTVPPEFSNAKGKDSEHAKNLREWGLLELPGPINWRSAYVVRSIKNVEDADGTVAFKIKASRGTDGTIQQAVNGRWKTDEAFVVPEGEDVLILTQGNKPTIIIKNMSERAMTELVSFIMANEIKTLNVAGHTKRSKGDGLPEDWEEQVFNFLVEALLVEFNLIKSN